MLNVTLNKRITRYKTDFNAVGLMEYVVLTLGVLISLGLMFCLCCFCMRLSDLKMRSYIMELAKKRGVKVDLDQIDKKRNCRSPLANENCTIFVPDASVAV